MKLFISWSGSRSKSVAVAIRDWLPLVLQYVKPWVSEKDIDAGDRWAQTISGELETSNFGIICITPENIQSEWILFEAGALSKSMLDAKVIPLLFNLELSDLRGPLSQFQAQKVDESGLMEIVKSINKVAGGQTDEKIVSRLVPQLWPSLQTEFDRIPDIAPQERHKRTQNDILEELVSGVRGINNRIRDFDPELMERNRDIRRRKIRFHPRIFEEIAIKAGDIEDIKLSLIFISGILRDDCPWIGELFLEAYRELKCDNLDEIGPVFTRLRRAIKYLLRGPMREFITPSRDVQFLIEEIPMILDMMQHRMADIAVKHDLIDAKDE